LEKRKPHYDLGTIQATFCEVKFLRMTRTATKCAEALGISRADIIVCIQSITRAQFHKSMTSDVDSRIWQDVYHASFGGTVLYVKFTTDFAGYLVISFKER
jgi:motility quorum-sensing regulator/GCU-specific mRNA interferase toxin